MTDSTTSLIFATSGPAAVAASAGGLATAAAAPWTLSVTLDGSATSSDFAHDDVGTFSRLFAAGVSGVLNIVDEGAVTATLA